MRPALGLLLICIISAGFVFGGARMLYLQSNGEKTMAEVTSCVSARRSLVCRGTWIVDGKAHIGVIDNADVADQGKRIEVIVDGERALKPGLRLPLVLFGLALTLLLLGAYWWFREVPKYRQAAGR